MEGFFCVGGARGAPNAKKQRTENREQSARQARDEESDGQSAGREWEVCPAGLTRRTTKNHEGSQRRQEMGNRRLRRLEPIRGRLPPARLQCFFGNHKGHKGHKGDWIISGLVDWRVWGAAPRPGREKFSLHPRHVCDVPSRRPQEIQEMQEMQERPYGATGADAPR